MTLAGRQGAPPERWLGIELRHLAALEVVAEELSFRRAAARLGYTQSAISQQIAALERVVGQRLVDRPGGRSQVALTPAGETLRQHAEAIGVRLAAARADLGVLAQTEATIRLGSLASLGGILLAEIVGAFRELAPGVAIDLSELSMEYELLRLLARGELDLVLTELPLPPGPFAAESILVDDCVLVAPSSGPALGQCQPTTLAELARRPLVGIKGCRCCDALLARLGALELDVSFAYTAQTLETLQGMVRAGLGLAVLPRLATDLIGAGLAIVELEMLDLPRREVAVVINNQRSPRPPVTSFLESAKAVGSLLQQRGTDRNSKAAA